MIVTSQDPKSELEKMAAARRHCMIVDNNYPDIRVERQANALLGRGYEVDVICLQGPGEPRFRREGRLRVYRLPVRRRRGAYAVQQLWEYTSFLMLATAMAMRRHLAVPYDTIQVHNVPDFLVFSAMIPKVLGARVILDLHDLMPEFFESRFGARMPGVVHRLVAIEERVSAAIADRVITVTELWRGTLISRGLARGKIDVVMNLPDERFFSPRPPQIRETSDVLVIYHGTITHRYGLDILLKAFATARHSTPMRMLIHGRGEYLDEVRRLANELGLADSIEISTALLATEDLADLISRADIGVVPNRIDTFTDGILPTKLLEYAALGVPAIVSRSQAVEAYFSPDMVRYVEPGEPAVLAAAIIELAKQPELRRSLATNAQRFSRDHRWSDEARRYVDLVDRLIESKQRKPQRGRERT